MFADLAFVSHLSDNSCLQLQVPFAARLEPQLVLCALLCLLSCALPCFSFISSFAHSFRVISCSVVPCLAFLHIASLYVALICLVLCFPCLALLFPCFAFLCTVHYLPLLCFALLCLAMLAFVLFCITVTCLAVVFLASMNVLPVSLPIALSVIMTIRCEKLQDCSYTFPWP